jgi:hypothetical protein
MPLPVDLRPIGRGRNPTNVNGEECLFYVSQESVDKFRRTHPPSKTHDGEMLEEIIGKAELIYKGLKRLVGLEEGFCFCCRPPGRCGDKGEKLDRIRGKSLLIYVEMRQYGPTVFDWDWRPCNESTGIPYEAPEAFGELIWPKH